MDSSVRRVRNAGKTLLSLLMAGLGLAALPCNGQFALQDVYIGAQGGFARAEFLGSHTAAEGQTTYEFHDDHDSFIRRLYVGINLSEAFCVEATVLDMGPFDTSVEFSDEGTGISGFADATIRIGATGVSVVGGVDVAESLRLFARLGAQISKRRVSWEFSPSRPDGSSGQRIVTGDSGMSLCLGVGAVYWAGETWGVRTEAEYYDVADNYYTLSVGLIWSVGGFGGSRSR